MFGDFTVFVKAENVKRDLFSGSGKIVDGLQEDIIAVFQCADIFLLIIAVSVAGQIRTEVHPADLLRLFCSDLRQDL